MPVTPEKKVMALGAPTMPPWRHFFVRDVADDMVRAGTLGVSHTPLQIIEGGLRQVWKARRQEERAVVGYGKGRVPKWNRRAVVNYTHTRTNKGNLMVWRFRLGKAETEGCRKCPFPKETGSHRAFGCLEGEARGRRWSSWAQMDEKLRWVKKEEREDGKVVVHYRVETWFAGLEL